MVSLAAAAHSGNHNMLMRPVAAVWATTPPVLPRSCFLGSAIFLGLLKVISSSQAQLHATTFYARPGMFALHEEAPRLSGTLKSIASTQAQQKTQTIPTRLHGRHTHTLTHAHLGCAEHPDLEEDT